jgi:hypothetical protein
MKTSKNTKAQVVKAPTQPSLKGDKIGKVNSKVMRPTTTKASGRGK